MAWSFAALWSCMWWLAVAAANTLPPFYGFRFETPAPTASLMSAVVDQARSHACFGWVQTTAQEHLVGEVRCRGQHGTAMQTWIESSHPQARVHVYESTKIRYHFTSFRVLEASRRTCFQSAPHACASLNSYATVKDEL
ncbi:hypothetical protein H257_08635 [Aphanomyces astaci]|uniref:Uncharacterized protein n=1 Tax=Aphanomyces astaci TaxID=112090 RepID=W4GDP4_APHAT|nr:hypothetical protein H257_08635 [Aphanomyces astaci]ETV77795.1 hypothetical protein H257_08635 [Aphanomyces astaci]|eukprot:XP_009832905.1 hypothetical protein H257_08635 [Aphanomyces astaci]